MQVSRVAGEPVFKSVTHQPEDQTTSLIKHIHSANKVPLILHDLDWSPTFCVVSWVLQECPWAQSGERALTSTVCGTKTESNNGKTHITEIKHIWILILINWYMIYQRQSDSKWCVTLEKSPLLLCSDRQEGAPGTDIPKIKNILHSRFYFSTTYLCRWFKNDYVFFPI